jgi:hypothetical protein
MCEKCNGEGIVIEQISTWGVFIKPCECREDGEVQLEEGSN